MGEALPKGDWSDGLAHWRDGPRAFVSISFSYRLRAARRVVEYYHRLGCHVHVGGPAIFSNYQMVANGWFGGMAEIPVAEKTKKNPSGRTAGALHDAVVRHNPMATFASRGCPVGCSFCIVPAMEGLAFTLLPEFTPRPVLCDNNLSALPADYQDHIVARYQAAGVRLLDANSGFEPRTFTEDVFARWRPLLEGPWRFAYDDQAERSHVERVMQMLKAVSPRQKRVYVLIGNEPREACFERIRQVIEWGGEPYVQPEMKLTTLVKKPWVRFDWTEHELMRVQRWVNRHAAKRGISYRDYDASARGRHA